MKDIFDKLLFGFLIAICIGVLIMMGVEIKKESDYYNSEEYKQLLIQQENCEHELYTTSSGRGRSLQVYSKCRKCGKKFY